ncbi:hypothetical protein CYMTET_34706 [Cymbomonas tetramitiformis]|uniref:Uncharacterized protein n=1 Tax=Cymbomonas tetramitiformis TaxID=36881 RepID=A0AAE0KPX4_9CHLO|nr:hypothetical protein CYMTET_34706 [Cymbomonas tetramitiformis]
MRAGLPEVHSHRPTRAEMFGDRLISSWTAETSRPRHGRPQSTPPLQDQSDEGILTLRNETSTSMLEDANVLHGLIVQRCGHENSEHERITQPTMLGNKKQGQTMQDVLRRKAEFVEISKRNVAYKNQLVWGSYDVFLGSESAPGHVQMYEIMGTSGGLYP